MSDTGMVAPGVPTLGYGLRGITCCEVILRGPKGDLHSGLFGGAVANPATAIARLVASLHTPDGRVADRGLLRHRFDRWKIGSAHMWSQAARRERCGFPASDRLARPCSAKPGYSSAERIWARPTAEVNGIGGGYQGEGSKTVIPAEAFVKLSFRLVPDQEPAGDHGPGDQPPRTPTARRACTLEIHPGHDGKPYLTDPNSHFGLAAQAALRAAFEAEPVLIREGGSIPIVQTFRDILGADTLLLGLALVRRPNPRA